MSASGVGGIAGLAIDAVMQEPLCETLCGEVGDTVRVLGVEQQVSAGEGCRAHAVQSNKSYANYVTAKAQKLFGNQSRSLYKCTQ